MCTLSWLSAADGLHVRFNRDESVDRARAEPLAVQCVGSFSFLAPIDPVGGGTWLSVSADGKIYALLNHYGVAMKVSADPRSRGMVPWYLASGKWSVSGLLADPSPLRTMRPFTLVEFAPGGAVCLSWCGTRLSRSMMDPHLGCVTSSSLDPDRVIALRRAAFECHVVGGFEEKSPALLDAFHGGDFTTGDPASSVLMDRVGRRTVSQSCIHIGERLLTFEEKIRDPEGFGFLTPACRISMTRVLETENEV